MPTLDEIRQEGLEALQERLGRAGMVRFLQLFRSGSGDYVAERQSFANRTSLDQIRKIASRRPRKSKEKK